MMTKDDTKWAAILAATILAVVVLIFGIRYLRDNVGETPLPEPAVEQLDGEALE